MSHSLRRRNIAPAVAALLFFTTCAAALLFFTACASGPAKKHDAATAASLSAPGFATATSAATAHLATLERSFAGRLGLFALDTGTGAQLRYRADERFPMCSTFKVLVVSAILERSRHVAGLMEQRIHYGRADLVTYSPITEKHLDDGLTVAELCAAALQHSDNTAANELMKLLGGPAAVTTFARSLGDDAFRLDRWEPALNTATPGDVRDTTTPAAMGQSLKRLTLGDTLAARAAEQLRQWLRGNTTGATRIRAGVPPSWEVGDKTGSGQYGTANDIAVLWPPHGAPVVIAIYTTQRQKDAQLRADIIVAATRLVVQWHEAR